MVTTKKGFALANRQRFVSRIAMGNYDAIIIGDSQFEKIPISRERQEHLLQDEIRSVAKMIDQIKKEKGDDWSIKQMVVFENNLKARLEKLANESNTKMRNVTGIGKSSSQRAMDMMLKCQYIQEINQGRGVVFATGTPISNSMSEMYVMQRYLQPQMLQNLGLQFFDRYVTKGTFDSYLWQIQEQKLRYISQVMTGKSPSRSCQDADETVLSAAEVKAIESQSQNEQVTLERRIQTTYPHMIAAYKEKIEKLQADIRLMEEQTESTDQEPEKELEPEI